MQPSNNLLNSANADFINSRAQNNVTGENANSYKATKTKLNHIQPLNRDPIKEPEKLKANFNLDESFNNAYKIAVDFANRILLDDDLSMKIQQKEQNTVAVVEDLARGSVVQEYNPIEVLQMYSSNYNLQGIVIDAII